MRTIVLSAQNAIAQIFNIGFGIIVFFIGTRLLLLFFSANANAPFVILIVTISNIFIKPFKGMFVPLKIGSHLLDVDSLVSIIVYTIVCYLGIGILNAIVSILTYGVEHIRRKIDVRPQPQTISLPF